MRYDYFLGLYEFPVHKSSLRARAVFIHLHQQPFFFRTLFEMGIRLRLKVGANPLATFVGIYRGNRIGE